MDVEVNSFNKLSKVFVVAGLSLLNKRQIKDKSNSMLRIA